MVNKTLATLALITSTSSYGAIELGDPEQYWFEGALGANYAETVTKFGDGVTPQDETGYEAGVHAGLSVRRAINDHSSWGMGLDYDDANGETLLTFRVIDYRYDFSGWSLGFYGGVGRMEDEIPEYGYAVGIYGRVQQLVAGADLELSVGYRDKVARDKLLPDDPAIGGATEIFKDVTLGHVALVWAF